MPSDFSTRALIAHTHQTLTEEKHALARKLRATVCAFRIYTAGKERKRLEALSLSLVLDVFLPLFSLALCEDVLFFLLCASEP